MKTNNLTQITNLSTIAKGLYNIAETKRAIHNSKLSEEVKEKALLECKKWENNYLYDCVVSGCNRYGKNA